MATKHQVRMLTDETSHKAGSPAVRRLRGRGGGVGFPFSVVEYGLIRRALPGPTKLGTVSV